MPSRSTDPDAAAAMFACHQSATGVARSIFEQDDAPPPRCGRSPPSGRRRSIRGLRSRCRTLSRLVNSRSPSVKISVLRHAAAAATSQLAPSDEAGRLSRHGGIRPRRLRIAQRRAWWRRLLAIGRVAAHDAAQESRWATATDSRLTCSPPIPDVDIKLERPRLRQGAPP